MSFFSSKTTVTPTNPAWVTSGIQGFFDKARDLSAGDPQQYVASWNPLQEMASQRAASLGASNPWLDEATKMINLVGNYRTPTAQSQSALTDLDKYMSPYTKDVVDAAMADFDYGAGRTRAQQDLDLVGARAFGGSGAALTRSMTEGELTRGRASTAATLRDQGFTRGAALSSEDAARRQQVELANQQAALQKQQQGAQLAELLASLGFQQAESNRQDVATQMAVGGARYGVDTTTAQAPLNLLQTTSGIAGGLPLQLFSGSKSKTSDPFGTFLKYMQTAADVAKVVSLSDRRLKRDIQRIATRPDGLGVYLYRYLWSPVQFVGVMAQEVLKVNPNAVLAHPSGYLMVDYSAL